jgi:hypothetical protein
MTEHTLEGSYQRRRDGMQFTYKATYGEGYRPAWRAQVYVDGRFHGEVGGVILNIDLPPQVQRQVAQELVHTSIERSVHLDQEPEGLAHAI